MGSQKLLWFHNISDPTSPHTTFQGQTRVKVGRKQKIPVTLKLDIKETGLERSLQRCGF